MKGRKTIKNNIHKVKAYLNNNNSSKGGLLHQRNGLFKKPLWLIFQSKIYSKYWNLASRQCPKIEREKY